MSTLLLHAASATSTAKSECSHVPWYVAPAFCRLLGSRESMLCGWQVVLVRSQASKKRLPVELESALVLTIFEAKGLEFDDVFIFDFFADSPADEKTWRVVTSILLQQQEASMQSEVHGEKQAIAKTAPRAEAFDKQKHSL
eukprot:2350722-Pleurochrysis_carterae.AAC.1